MILSIWEMGMYGLFFDNSKYLIQIEKFHEAVK
jgi:hypothetical protein